MPDAAAMNTLPPGVRLLKQLVAVMPSCSWAEFRVLSAFASFTDANGEAWPSVETLAATAGMATPHVKAALRSLSTQQPATTKRANRPALLTTVARGGGVGRSTTRRLQLYGFSAATLSVAIADPNRYESRHRSE